MKTMTITIERKPLTIQFDGKEMQVEELGIRLPFGRKPVTMSEIAGSEDCTVYITARDGACRVRPLCEEPASVS